MFTLGGKSWLICCPQGIAREEKRFLNTHCAAYLGGELDYQQAHFNHGDFTELDAGFEFYAPQTTEDASGRRLLVGWMGVPGGEEMRQPTVAAGWIHQMTCLRELSVRDGKLYQNPVAELQVLRGEEQHYQGSASQAPALDAQRLELIVESQGEVTLDFADTLVLRWQKDELRLARRSLETGEWQYRYWTGAADKLHILCDHSSVEIFINDGEGVMSSRYFPDHPPRLTFSGQAELQTRYWSLRPCMVE